MLGSSTPSAPTMPKLLFLVGASGVGKTATLARLRERHLPGVSCYDFDSIGVPDPATMLRDYGSGERWQEAATTRWVETLLANSDQAAIAVLEGQTRPSFIRAALAHGSPTATSIVLLDCVSDVRVARLSGPRGQPELATAQMDHWAAYLRGQADALGLPVIDTSTLSLDDVTDALAAHVGRLARDAA